MSQKDDRRTITEPQRSTGPLRLVEPLITHGPVLVEGRTKEVDPTVPIKGESFVDYCTRRSILCSCGGSIIGIHVDPQCPVKSARRKYLSHNPGAF